jgi:hypothetical protein
VVNVLGYVVIGLLAGFIAANRLTLRPYWREFILVGMLGGFDNNLDIRPRYVLAQSNARTERAPMLNIAVQLMGGLLALRARYRVGV